MRKGRVLLWPWTDSFLQQSAAPYVGETNDIELSCRIYTCSNCSTVIDRDLNAALNILQEGLSQVPVEHRELKPVETVASTRRMLEYLNSIPHLQASLVREAGSLTASA